VVYNQCSNLVLAAAIRSHTNLEVKRLEKIESDITEDPYIPAPPKPEEIDCIIAGFPWSVMTYFRTLFDYTEIASQPAPFASEHVRQSK
jgi:hypothetical protein